MNISFQLTTDQIRNRTKDVTRRLGWKKLRAGQILTACEKCMGLKKGEKPVKLTTIRVVAVHPEVLHRMILEPEYGKRECVREGFPEMTPRQFVEMFCHHMKVTELAIVTRIEFEYEVELAEFGTGKPLGRVFITPSNQAAYRRAKTFVEAFPEKESWAMLQNFLSAEQINEIGHHPQTKVVIL